MGLSDCYCTIPCSTHFQYNQSQSFQLIIGFKEHPRKPATLIKKANPKLWRKEGQRSRKSYKEYKLVRLVRLVGKGPTKPPLEKSLRTHMTPTASVTSGHAPQMVDLVISASLRCFQVKSKQRRGKEGLPNHKSNRLQSRHTAHGVI